MFSEHFRTLNSSLLPQQTWSQPPRLTYFDTQKLHPRDHLQKHCLSVQTNQWINSQVLPRVIQEVDLQRHAKRTYLVHARTKPQRLKKISINPFVPLSCVADQNSNRGYNKDHGRSPAVHPEHHTACHV